jgi:alkanesulfonate monooxygenase SsuD/methylene tetrahydromethanopterin reductase-like flavin-dependent oxidoreductase (luciferase family)
MRFGIFFLLHAPRPWDEKSTSRVVEQALEQAELADRLGFDSAWATEHHFLEEYSHSAAPEIFLGAMSQRTKNLRLGHGIVALPTPYNHPVRVAERAAFLDVLSSGRLELGTGETSSPIELGGFGIDRAEKRQMWEESIEAVARLCVEEPFTGAQSKYVNIPQRNLVPKPMQQPHPPLWVACSRRETIAMAARRGIGALTFAFIDPSEAEEYVHTYYNTLEEEGSPIGLAVNPNIAVVTSLLCHPDEQTAIDRGIDGPHFFAYSLAHYYIFGSHRPGRTNLWEEFLANREMAGMSRQIIKATGKPLTAKVTEDANFGNTDDSESFRKATESQRGAIGTPDQIRDFLRQYEEVGVDHMIFNVSTGVTQHEHIVESLDLFARDVMPEFKERAPQIEAAKQERLAPVLEKVMGRKPAEHRAVDTDYHVDATAQM